MAAREQVLKDMTNAAHDLKIVALFAMSSGVVDAVPDLRQCVGIIERRVALEREEALCTSR